MKEEMRKKKTFVSIVSEPSRAQNVITPKVEIYKQKFLNVSTCLIFTNIFGLDGFQELRQIIKLFSLHNNRKQVQEILKEIYHKTSYHLIRKTFTN